VFALHVGVERIGRYLQVFHEADGSDGLGGTDGSDESGRPDGSGGSGRSGESSGSGGLWGWEHAAMAFGRPAGAVTSDALFTVPFLIAAFINAAPALIADPARVELVFVGGAHALFVLRLISARQAAGRQRAIDLERFQKLKNDKR
jgi:hypothetical protein